MFLVELACHKKGQAVVKYKTSDPRFLLFLVFCLNASTFEKYFNYIIILNYIIFLIMSIVMQFLNTGCAHFSLLDFCDFFTVFI